MEKDEIFKLIVSSYQSLWQMKDYGATIEIITPVATANNMFVSIFITKRGNEYIATDGGWIDSELYESEINWDSNIFSKIGAFYISNMDIKKTSSNNKTFYYKKIDRLDLLPADSNSKCEIKPKV